MDSIDSKLQDLNAVILEIESKKTEIIDKENQITNLDDAVKFNLIAVTGAAVISSISCVALRLTNVLSNDMCLNAVSISTAGALVICGVSDINYFIKNIKLKEDIENSKKTLDYLNKVYNEKINKLSDTIVENVNQTKTLKKDN